MNKYEVDKNYEAVMSSTNDRDIVRVIRIDSETGIIVLTTEGVLCQAIINCYNGLIYADDVYGKLKVGIKCYD